MMENRKIYLILVLIWLAHWAVGQNIESFEDETNGTTTFTDDGQDFNIAGSTFDINSFGGAGWDGESAADSKFIDNTGESAGNNGTTLKIYTDDGTDFNVTKLFVFCANTSLLAHSGTISFTGYKDSNETSVYTFTRNSGFANVTAFSPNNGYTEIDFSTDGATDFTDDAIDSLVIESTGDLEYIALDGFTWSKVTSVAGPTSATVAATVLLEGAWNGSDMNTLLKSGGLMSLTAPYDTINNHNGSESVAADSDIPVDIVDWVLVELREADVPGDADADTRVGSAAGFLKSNGQIVATDGSSDLTISLTGNTGADFFVVVYHRNHLPIMSLTEVSESSGKYTIDLSVSANVYEAGDAVSTLSGSTKVGMHAGDLDQDGDIDDYDLSTWRTNNGAAYMYGISGKADFNLDGVINAIDRNEFHQKNKTKTSQLPVGGG